MSGVPVGLARHMGHQPPERVPITLDRNDESGRRIADVANRSIAGGNGDAIRLKHVGSCSAVATTMPCSRSTSQSAPARWWPNEHRSASVRCWDQAKHGGPLGTITRRSCSSERPSAFFRTQFRANDRNASAVPRSSASIRGTGSRRISAMSPPCSRRACQPGPEAIHGSSQHGSTHLDQQGIGGHRPEPPADSVTSSGQAV